MTEIQEKNTTWLDEEEKQLTTPQQFEKLPYLVMEENKIVEIDIDFTQPFQTYTTTNSKGLPMTKAILPVTHDKVKKSWFLNKKNPTYREIIQAGKAGQTHFKVLQTGKQAETKYILVK